MKLTQMHDGRWLLEHDSGVVLPLTTSELDGLVVRIAHRLHVEEVVPLITGVGLRVSTEFSGSTIIYFRETDEIPEVLAVLRKRQDASAPLTKQDVFPDEEAA